MITLIVCGLFANFNIAKRLDRLWIALEKYQDVLMGLAQLAVALELPPDPDLERTDRGDQDRLVVKDRPAILKGIYGIADEVAIEAALVS